MKPEMNSKKDLFTAHRDESKLNVKKPTSYGGLKNNTYLRPQPK